MDVMPSGDLLATILSVLNFLFTHEISITTRTIEQHDFLLVTDVVISLF